MLEVLATSPDQQAEGARRLAYEFGETDPRTLDMIEVLTWMVMQAAVENPGLRAFDWSNIAWSAVTSEDVEGLDELRLKNRVAKRSIQAQQMISEGGLVSKEERIKDPRRRKGCL